MKATSDLDLSEGDPKNTTYVGIGTLGEFMNESQ